MNCNTLAVAALAALVVTLPCAEAHGNIHRVTGKFGSASMRNNIRDGVQREDSGIPGAPWDQFLCDHCVLENRPRHGSINGQFWTETPGAHIDNPSSWPEVPCMSFEGYGSRGVLDVEAGEELFMVSYMNADHGGFYRFELANGTNPSNEAFRGSPISPYYSLHNSAETNNFYNNRVVGWTTEDTRNYIYDMNRVPGAGLGGQRLNPSSQDSNSGFCQSNYHSCFLEDRVVVPTDVTNGPAVIRWMWYSLETSQVYSNCIDVNIGGSVPQPPGSPTDPPTLAPAPTSAPPPPASGCSQCWDQNGANNCGMWCTRAWNEGCAAVGCSSNECDFC